jgi:hypothetical protein
VNSEGDSVTEKLKLSKSQSYITTGQSVGQSVLVSVTHLGLATNFPFSRLDHF